MIGSKKAREIYKAVEAEWMKRYGKKFYDKGIQSCLKVMKEAIKDLPDEDGCKRVQNLDTGKTHLVPVVDIILHGLKGDELDKYPLVESK